MRIDDKYLINLHTKLVNIPSVFPNEKEIMLFLEDELKCLGFTPHRLTVTQDRFNLLVRIGNGSPILCLNAHSDTVPPSGESVPKAKIKNGRMYGLGSADDKASIAAMVAAIRAISESDVKLNGTLDLFISVDEEGDAQGVRSAIENNYKCDMVITGEPTNLQMVPTHCGLLILEITTYGKSTHGSIPMQGVNAIDRMFELISGLRKVATEYPSHPLIGPGTMNLGIIKGGDRPNRVPDRCEAAVDIRLVPPMTVKELLNRIRQYFDDWKGKADYNIAKQGEPLNTPHDSNLVCALASAGEKILGHAPEIVGWRGWTDAESFQTGIGVDAVVFGPGKLEQAHSANEYVDLEQVCLAARIYAEVTTRLLAK